MSIQVTLPELAETLTRYHFAYLMTVGDDEKAHVVAVNTRLEGETLVLSSTGRRARGNVSTRPSVTLVWPPTDPTEFSLIVDGVASLLENEVAVAFTTGVLHRPAPVAAVEGAGSA
jgi:hypothetical protein